MPKTMSPAQPYLAFASNMFVVFQCLGLTVFGVRLWDTFMIFSQMNGLLSKQNLLKHLSFLLDSEAASAPRPRRASQGAAALTAGRRRLRRVSVFADIPGYPSIQAGDTPLPSPFSPLSNASGHFCNLFFYVHSRGLISSVGILMKIAMNLQS